MSSAWNPPSRFTPVHIAWDEAPPPAKQKVREDLSRSVLNHVDRPELDFNWSLNPYRGCSHACAYCYARTYHEYLGLGAGTDFERQLFVKPDAAALLERALRRPSWSGELINFSGATDCYQPLERRHRLTRACLEVCLRYRNPVSIVTRSPLITRDLDLLGALHQDSALVFLHRLQQAMPTRAAAVENRIRRLRAGTLDQPRPTGPGQSSSWTAIRQLYDLWHRRLGFVPRPPLPDPSPFRVPGTGQQASLF